MQGSGADVGLQVTGMQPIIDCLDAGGMLVGCCLNASTVASTLAEMESQIKQRLIRIGRSISRRVDLWASYVPTA